MIREAFYHCMKKQGEMTVFADLEQLSTTSFSMPAWPIRIRVRTACGSPCHGVVKAL
jgi:hypothetical protein